ncbi:ZC3H3 family protein [Megaselia abdita]
MQPLENVHPSFLPSGKIFINPNFKNPPQTHINPNFLQSKQPPQQPSSIYVNPAFLNKNKEVPSIQEVKPAPQPAEIITKTRTKLIRKHSVPSVESKAKAVPSCSTTSSPLIKIGLNKLVRASTLRTKPRPKTEFISRFALSRKSNLSNDKLKVTKVKTVTKSVHKKLQLLNINGIIYKSTATKLQRKNSNEPTVISVKEERVIKVRGDRFVLDKNGKSLTRVNANDTNTDDKKLLKRIDIGGLTYVAKSKNVFVRTDLHKTRNHLSQARNKSLTVLSKNRVKTNIPCAIYRKLGKCAAHEKGRCPKKHDPDQIVVCTKFLRGDCTTKNCLLSHNVSLSKMPVCKFFLQGLCVRDDCPYLHKKLNEKAQICMEFQRGFCKLADKVSSIGNAILFQGFLFFQV